MHPKSALPAYLHAALKKGDLVLTANERAAQVLRHRFDKSSRAEGLYAWQPPNILSWSAWTSSLWHRMLLAGHPTELLLNRSQEQALWLSILRGDASLSTLRSLESLADLAMDAFRLTCSYEGEKLLQSAGGGSDARSFQRWAAEFDRTCRSGNLLPAAKLEARLSSAILAEHLPLPSSVHLIGFESRTPAQEKFLQTAISAGLTSTEPSLPPPLGEALHIVAPNPSQEILSAASWAGEILRKNPDAEIAILSPSLEKQRWIIDHLFRRTLPSPPSSTHPNPSGAPLFEFAAGTPLSSAPLVSAALDLLRWVAGALPLDRISSLLLSHHFADQAPERKQRAAFDAHLLRRSRRLRPEMTIEDLRQILGETRATKYNLPHLRMALLAMRRAQDQLAAPATQKTFEDWSEAIRNYLTAASWAAGVERTPLESQLHRAWQSALDELATLSFRGNRVGFDEVLRTLTRILETTAFKAESHYAPIQIMSPADSAGSAFDALWFLDATDLAWPPPLTSNPLLPRALQQNLGIPGADTKLDLESARDTTSRVASSASQIVFSYAREGSEGTQRPSPLLHGITSPPSSAESLIPLRPDPEPVQLEAVADKDPIPHPPSEVPGGARVLELQAACGFRAFAELRLASAGLREYSLGMDAGERGSLVHKALEFVWKTLPSQAALRQLSPVELETLLQQCAQLPLDKALQLATGPWDFAYLAAQRDRLIALLRHWLQIELSRPPFEVLERERSLRAECGPLLLNLRLDRVDKAADRTLLIDYKTGPANQSGWMTDRPDSPQLPLYAVASNLDALGGLAFAHVRAGKDAKLTGIATSMGILSPKKLSCTEDEFQAQLADWRRVLSALADAFYQGDASIHPKQFPKTCLHCEQRIVCRVDPSLFEASDQEEEDSQVDAYE